MPAVRFIPVRSDNSQRRAPRADLHDLNRTRKQTVQQASDSQPKLRKKHNDPRLIGVG